MNVEVKVVTNLTKDERYARKEEIVINIFFFLLKTAIQFTYKNIVNIEYNKLFIFCVMLHVTIHNKILKQLNKNPRPLSYTKVMDFYLYANYRLHRITKSKNSYNFIKSFAGMLEVCLRLLDRLKE